jgi:hypothetical protein
VIFVIFGALRLADTAQRQERQSAAHTTTPQPLQEVAANQETKGDQDMKLRTMLKNQFVQAGLLSLTTALLLSSAVLAQEEKRDHQRTGQTATAEAKILPILPQLELATESSPASQMLAASAPGAATFSAALTVQVDHSYCRTGGIQCFLPGQEPNDLNRNPVRLGIQVLSGGLPVNGLTDADINIINPFVPAGGSAISQISGASTFQAAGNGIYTIFVAPGVGQTWKPGSYFVQVQVNVGGTLQRALAQIEIPF